MKELYKYIIIMALTFLAVIALIACARYYEPQSMALLMTACVLFGMGLFITIKVMLMFFGGRHHGNKK